MQIRHIFLYHTCHKGVNRKMQLQELNWQPSAAMLQKVSIICEVHIALDATFESEDMPMG